ncbi:TIGR02234 family membrane protein [Corynebacterium aurimucosum]|uniref:TIGR02234 family membrane protein n=1 Tax=Corynebacterium aurimucosum TaxID=169292 RepID=UPI00399098EF
MAKRTEAKCTEAKHSGAKRIGPVLMFVGAILLWLSSRMTWVTAAVEDDKAGSSVVELSGSLWSLELIALSVVVLAGGVAAFALRRTGRRIVSVLTALAAAAAGWRPVALLTAGPETERAQELLQGGTNDTSVDSATISDWATVLTADASTVGPVLAIAGAALALFGAVMVASNPGADKPRSAKYETPVVRQERLQEDLETSQDSGRVMWDALDADIDPTDPRST